MCGISGVIKNEFSKIDLRGSILKIVNLQNHRGPDKSDIIKINENIIFGHNRLSIQDLSEKGDQPMFSQDNNLLITFNGEIYNHMKLRNTLTGQKWKSTCDTETIVNLIEKKGIIKALNLIEGMFAFACFNKKEQKIYLARDRFGEKPLYYYSDNNFFAFTSEIFPLTQVDGINKKINENSILNFLKYSYIGSPNSIYKKISKLKAGCVLEINLLNFQRGREYFKIYRWTKLSEIVENSKKNIITNFYEAKNELEKKISYAVEKQMISDVPIGSFLSGGIDSSLVTALMQKHSKNKVETFSIKFENSDYDESSYARSVSRVLNTNHNELLVSHKNILDTIENINGTFGEPFGDSSQVPMYLLSKFTKEKVTVSLSGDGADELFCGYSRYKYIHDAWRIYKILNLKNKSIHRLLDKIPLNILKKIVNLISFSKIPQLEDKISKFKNITKDIVRPDDMYFKLISNIDVEIENENLKLDFGDYDIREKMMLSDIDNYLSDDILCKVDRTAMQNSLETRLPFLDKEVFEYAWKLPLEYKIKSNETKFILKKILENYLPKNLIYRQKMGFSLPMNDLLNTDLKIILHESLDYFKKLNFNFMEKINIKDLQRNYRHDARRNNLLWNIIILANWMQKNKSNYSM